MKRGSDVFTLNREFSHSYMKKTCKNYVDRSWCIEINTPRELICAEVHLIEYKICDKQKDIKQKILMR